MKTIQFVQNGKGEMEAVPVQSTAGHSLFNAVGDITGASTGYKYAIDTLTYIKAKVTKQKFYTVSPADYLPVIVGSGNYADQIITNAAYTVGGNFASGIISTGDNTRWASVDAAVAPISQAVRAWGKQISYNIMEIQQAMQANNWDPIMAKEESRKRNYDLGIQEVAFLGLAGDTAVTGLLNNAVATINTTAITAPISGLNAANFQTFIQTIISAYFTATASTQMPNRFVMPYSDYIGLAVPFPGTAGTYPLPMIDYIEMAFKKQTGRSDFKILPLAYADAANNTAFGINKQCYALYNYDDESLAMEVPVPYTTTAVNSVNNFSFQNVGYSRFTGVGLFRPLELLYFRY